MPQTLLGRSIERSLIDLVTVALALLALSVALAVWLGRRIAAPIYRLQQAAARLERNEPVAREATGVVECDHVNTALADASERIRAANAELERRVADAVATTEQVQAQLAGTQRLEALGRLTGGVAHDFNNLLAVINNNLFMLQRRTAAGVPAAELAAIQRAVNTGVRLTRQLLAFSRRQPLQPQRLLLQHQLLAIAELIESSLGKAIALAVEIAPDVAPIEVDAAELELALINLAMNAKDAMPEGGRLSIRAHDAGADALPGRSAAMVAIEVVDTGTGIPADVLDRVFDPFFTTKSAGQGTGLGLSQVYGFCAQAGGTARIASVPGAGTTVTMLLPAAADAAEGIADPAARNAAVHPMRVLLVDDNVDLVLATAPMLETFGFAVTTAFSADEALRILDKDGIDVVLSDVSMPGERNGLDLARHVRGARPSIPVVLMTGYTAELQRAVAEGFKVLQKPCTPERVAAALQEASAPALRD